MRLTWHWIIRLNKKVGKYIFIINFRNLSIDSSKTSHRVVKLTQILQMWDSNIIIQEELINWNNSMKSYRDWRNKKVNKKIFLNNFILSRWIVKTKEKLQTTISSIESRTNNKIIIKCCKHSFKHKLFEIA